VLNMVLGGSVSNGFNHEGAQHIVPLHATNFKPAANLSADLRAKVPVIA